MGDYGLSAMFRIYESILNIKKKKKKSSIVHKVSGIVGQGWP